MNKKDVLTKKQEQRFYEETLNALKALVEAPERNDLIREIQIGGYGCVRWLYLSAAGLFEVSSAAMDSVRKVKPSADLVRAYNLTARELVELLARLKA